MFDNIGGKIKNLAKIITWVFIGFSVLVGIFTFTVNIIGGILIIIIGSVAAWVGSFLLYGFGELIESNQKMQTDIDTTLLAVNSLRNEVFEIKAIQLQQAQQAQKKATNAYKPSESSGDDKIYCVKCGRGNIPTMTYCANCGSKLQ